MYLRYINISLNTYTIEVQQAHVVVVFTYVLHKSVIHFCTSTLHSSYTT